MPLPSAVRKIVVSEGDSPRYIEGECDTAISIGAACELNADGKYDAWAGTAGSKDEVIICVEQSLIGETVNDGAATPAPATTTADTQIKMFIPKPGDVCHILVLASEDITVGDLLTRAATAGKFIEVGSEAQFDFKALETLTSASDFYIKARRL